jgi:hypothetical protein
MASDRAFGVASRKKYQANVLPCSPNIPDESAVDGIYIIDQYPISVHPSTPEWDIGNSGRVLEVSKVGRIPFVEQPGESFHP